MEEREQYTATEAATDQTTALYAALSAAQGQMKNVVPTGHATVGGGRDYAYATLDAILDVVRPVLAANGLSLMMVPIEGGVQTVLAHSGGGVLQFIVPFPVVPQAPQAMGSLLTYLRRYIVCGLFGIAADRDDDAQLAEQAARANAIRAHQDAAAEAGDEPRHVRTSTSDPKPKADIPPEVKAARQRFYTLWQELGYDRKDTKGMEDFLRSAVGDPGLWFSKATAAQLDKAHEALRKEAGLMAPDDGPFAE